MRPPTRACSTSCCLVPVTSPSSTRTIRSKQITAASIPAAADARAQRLCSARVISTGHALIQNLRRGHYELGMDVDPMHRLPAAFGELALTV